MVTNDRNNDELFEQLRDDVQKYFIVNVKSRYHYLETVLEKEERLRDYQRHKNLISRICGNDASGVKYDQTVYDLAIRCLTNLMDM
ncbi:MAG: hypothetical protein AABX59_03050 [Nanoarchaeota archaeon]